MNAEERNAILKLVKEYSDIFHIDGNQLTFTSKIKHKIKTSDGLPIYNKIPRDSPKRGEKTSSRYA